MENTGDDRVHSLVDHLFRHEAGKMVSVLGRIFGFDRIEIAEDIVQETMLKAITEWKYGKIPDNPSAWLYRVSKNKAIDILRREKLFENISSEISYMLRSEWTLVPYVNTLFLENEIQDSQLRMMFACCHPSLSPESQITLILKHLCGFSIPEIARGLLSNEETISKRLFRAKEKVKAEKIQLDVPAGKSLILREDIVLKAIYLLFSEGYNSSHPDRLIKRDLCEEAFRLCHLLSVNGITKQPKVFALLALICLQAARFDSRLDDNGSIILLKEQDRSLWNKAMIRKGIDYLNMSAEGTDLSEYHIEAAIAYYHAVSENYSGTNWEEILRLYDILLKIKDSPVIQLNRSVVLSQLYGPEKALEALKSASQLDSYYLYHATLGELYMQMNRFIPAEQHLERAIALTQSQPERELLRKKMEKLKFKKN